MNISSLQRTVEQVRAVSGNPRHFHGRLSRHRLSTKTDCNENYAGYLQATDETIVVHQLESIGAGIHKARTEQTSWRAFSWRPLNPNRQARRSPRNRFGTLARRKCRGR